MLTSVSTLSLVCCVSLLVLGLSVDSFLVMLITTLVLIGLTTVFVLKQFVLEDNVQKEELDRVSPWPAPVLVWSRGLYAIADHTGDDTFEYLSAGSGTSSSGNFHNLRGKKGVIWIRNNPTDLSKFAEDALDYLSGPTVLVTTDGDTSVPDELAPRTFTRIVGNPNIVAWYGQNVNTRTHAKMRSFPIGLDLHSPWCEDSNPCSRVTLLNDIHRKSFLPWNERKPQTLFSDVHLTNSRYGYREIWNTVVSSTKANFLEQRVSSREELWSKYYCTHQFVVSLPGNGMDCYRTYEIAFFGAVVVTVHSYLDELYKKMNIPVCYVADDFSDVHEAMSKFEYSNTPLKFFNMSDWDRQIQQEFYVEKKKQRLI